MKTCFESYSVYRHFIKLGNIPKVSPKSDSAENHTKISSAKQEIIGHKHTIQVHYTYIHNIIIKINKKVKV